MVKKSNAAADLGVDVLADAPLYEQVRDSLTRLVLERTLSDSTPLPTEPNLMDLFGVSRGTLRRAIEDLVRDGLLSAEQGRGTFVIQEERVRRVVWQRLSEVAKPDSRFDMDLRNFVPDFAGSTAAHKRVAKRSEWAPAKVIFVPPITALSNCAWLLLSLARKFWSRLTVSVAVLFS